MGRLLIVWACVLGCVAEEGAAPPDLADLEPGPALSRALPDPVPPRYLLPPALERIFDAGAPSSGEGDLGSCLAWLAGAQRFDGSWMGVSEEESEDPQARQIETTARVLHAFLGAGYDHRTGQEYRETVGRGIDFLVDAATGHPVGDGRAYDDPRIHALALIAIGEAFALTNDRDLRPVCQRGVEALDRMALRDHRGRIAGWGRVPEVADAGTTLAAVLAVRCLRGAGIDRAGDFDLGERLAECRWRYRELFRAANGDPEDLDVHGHCAAFPRRWGSEGIPVGEDFGAVTSAAGMALFLGARAGDTDLECLANTLEVAMVRDWCADRFDVERAYLRALVSFQLGGGFWPVATENGEERPSRWRSARTWTQLRALDWYRTEGTRTASFTPSPAFVARHGEDRVLATAYGCLIQEFYYRPWLD